MLAALQEAVLKELISPGPPLKFRQIQAAVLLDWQGDAGHPEIRKLTRAIRQICDSSLLDGARAAAMRCSGVERIPRTEPVIGYGIRDWLDRQPRRGLVLLATAFLCGLLSKVIWFTDWEPNPGFLVAIASGLLALSSAFYSFGPGLVVESFPPRLESVALQAVPFGRAPFSPSSRRGLPER